MAGMVDSQRRRYLIGALDVGGAAVSYSADIEEKGVSTGGLCIQRFSEQRVLNCGSKNQSSQRGTSPHRRGASRAPLSN